MSKSSKFELPLLTFNLPILQDQLYVWHREDRKRPSIFLRIPRGEVQEIRDVGLNWGTLDLDPKAIQDAFASNQGLGKHRRRVITGEDGYRVEFHVDMTFILNKDKMTIAVIIENRNTGKQCALRITVQAAALYATPFIYERFAYLMRMELIMRDGPGLTTGPKDTLLSDMLDAVDHADQELNRRHQEAQRLRVSTEEEQEHQEAQTVPVQPKVSKPASPPAAKPPQKKMAGFKSLPPKKSGQKTGSERPHTLAEQIAPFVEPALPAEPVPTEPVTPPTEAIVTESISPQPPADVTVATEG